MGALQLKTEFSTYNELYIMMDKYYADDSPYIELCRKNKELVATLTKCLNDMTMEENESYIDTNNYPWAMEFIIQNKLGRPSGRKRKSGFCRYPAVIFDMEKLKEYELEIPEENE